MARMKYSYHQKEKVWSVVADVPYGRVTTYGDVARTTRPQCSPRFVGWALSQAHPSSGLPWHRVLAAGGRIVVTGSAADQQRARLQAEGVQFQRNSVRLDLHRFHDLER